MNWLNPRVKKPTIFLLFASSGLLLVLICFNLWFGKPQIISKIVHNASMLDPLFFSQAKDKGITYQGDSPTTVYGGIIPHHLLAAPLVAGFFQALNKQKIETVVILGPDHYYAGLTDISSSLGDWHTVYGDLKPDLKIISLLEKQRLVSIKEDLFDNEQSIAAIVTFIKETFPNAKVVPLVLKGSTTKAECDKLADFLTQTITGQTLFLASVDFSHYLTSEKADFYDKESIGAIEAFDFEKALSLHPTNNFDSPAAIYTLLKIMQREKATQAQLLVNSNSAKLTHQPNLTETTSYVTMYFTQPNKNLSLESIFDYQDPDKAPVSKPGEYVLLATGDVILARSVNSQMVSKNNFRYPFAKTADFLRNSDLTFINLESPLIPNCPLTNEGMVFCGSQKAVEGLVFAGVDVANLANNHTADYGLDGLGNTVSLLRQNKIETTGTGTPAILTVKGKKFGFLGFNDIPPRYLMAAEADEEKIINSIKDLRNKVDYVIVAFHWGVEYTSSASARQKELAHLAIDSGADLIIGNHPHWVQGVEQYKNKFITYAHGNFIFDQMWSPETREGVIGRYVFDNHGLKAVNFYPVVIENYAQPRFAGENEAVKILNKMRALRN